MRKRLVLLVVLMLPALPAGALAAAKPVSTKLTAKAVAPKSTAKASGAVVVRLNAKGRKACWTLTVKGSAGRVLSAHVHVGSPGKLGPVVLPLGDRWSKTGCVIAKPGVIAKVAASPERYYVDVHTEKHVNGALRGQLRAGA
jgi:hypothetical protein